jgi:hypothetical protein
MSSVGEHYAQHLAPVYSWLLGGIEDAVAHGQRELMEMGLLGGGVGYAVDLGAGFGMHAMPLARHCWRVLAIDTSPALLAELRAQVGGDSVVTVQDDLLHFDQYLSGRPDALLCMGDTLTHLSDLSAVRTLFCMAYDHLSVGGRFVLTFRNYSQALEGLDRFIPVKSDDSRIFTCFLEYGEDTVRVNDILYERTEAGWRTRVSAYQKLRLAPQWVQRQLENAGFVPRMDAGPSGLVRIIAIRR